MNTATSLLLLAGIIAFTSCSENKNDETDSVDRSGAVETSVTVQHIDSAHDVLIYPQR